MSNADVKKLLRKGKLSGKEAALLVIQHAWEEIVTGKGFLSDTEIAQVRSSIRPGQEAIYNDHWDLFQAAWYSTLDAGRISLGISAACGDLYHLLLAYGAESRLRDARRRLPKIATAKEYEEQKLAQRANKLLQPQSLGVVLSDYMPQEGLASEKLIQDVTAFIERERPGDDEYTYGGLEEGLAEYTEYPGLLSYVLEENREPELARPWLDWLLEMLRGGRLDPVHYTEEAANLAHGYFERNRDYARIYEEQSQRPGARDTAALIETIERYLAGELEPSGIDDMLWDTFVTGPELYETGLAKYQEYIDDYIPMPPEWPLLAILQEEKSFEAYLLIDKETGYYKQEFEDSLLHTVSLYDTYSTLYEKVDEGGLDGYLVNRRKHLVNRLRELMAFRLGLQAASAVLGIKLMDDRDLHEVQAGYHSIEQFNRFILMSRVNEEVSRQYGEDLNLPVRRLQPSIPIDPIVINSLEPDERAVKLVQEKMGKLLPVDWAEQTLEHFAEEENDEPA